MSSAIIQGSIGAIAQQQGKSIAETFMSADAIAIVDTSGSMAVQDSRGERSRYEVACDELAALQNSLPGKIAVISFSDHTQFCPAGVPFFEGMGTDLARALRFCKIADVPGMRFVVISDGEPNDPAEALRIAATYQARIDVIYVGPEALPGGRDFLVRLAAASGGQTVTADRAQELASATRRLLLT